MDLDTLASQAIEDTGTLVRTSVMLRDDQIKAIEKLSKSPRIRKNRRWSEMHRAALDIGIAFIAQKAKAAKG